MAKQKKSLNKLVLFIAGIFVIFYVLAIYDAIMGSEMPSVVTNAEYQIGYQRWDATVAVEDGKIFETFKTLQMQTGDAVTVTKNGESYRFGSKAFIILKSFLWIGFTALVIIFMKKGYKFKNALIYRMSNNNITGMSLTVPFLLLIFFIGF